MAYIMVESLNTLNYERGLTNIVGRVTGRFQSALSMSFLGKPKVCDNDVSLTVEQQVLWLEVPVSH